MRRFALVGMTLVALATGPMPNTPLGRAQDCCSGDRCGTDSCGPPGCGTPDCIDRRYGCGPFLPGYYESPLAGTYVMADLVAFRRDRQTSQTFATLDTPTDEVLGTDDLPLVFQPGLRALAGVRLGDFWALEASFLGLFEWDESAIVRDDSENIDGLPGNLLSPMSDFGDPPQIGLDFNTRAAVRLQSRFNGGELNLRQILNSPGRAALVTALYGMRYMNLREDFEYRTQSLLPVGFGTDHAADVTTTNDLFGGQLGVMFDLMLHAERCWVNIEAKGMLLRNSTTQSTLYNVGPIDGGGLTFSGERTQARATLGADVAVTMVWAFTPGIIGRVGYQGIFLDGLALAADNFAANAPFLTTDPNLLDREGHLAFHGPFAGLELTW